MQGFLLSVLYSFVGCLGFCVVYCLRRSEFFAATLGGAVGWAVYLLFSFTKNDIFQYFVAMIAIAVYAEIMARIFKSPVTVFLIIALLPLVPGGGIYHTMEYCISGNVHLFAREGLHTLFIAGALALGIAIVSSVVRLIRRIGKGASDPFLQNR